MREASPIVLRRLEDVCKGGSVPELEQIMLLLSTIMKDFAEIYIFVDGLDEVMERDRKLFFQLVGQMITVGSPSSVKLIISGR